RRAGQRWGVGEPSSTTALWRGATAPRRDVAMQPLDERGRRRLPVDDEWTESVRMEHEPHRVRWPELRDLLRIQEECPHPSAAFVDLEHVPEAIEDEGGVWLLRLEHEVEGAASLGERRRVQVGRPVDRREAGR